MGDSASLETLVIGGVPAQPDNLLAMVQGFQLVKDGLHQSRGFRSLDFSDPFKGKREVEHRVAKFFMFQSRSVCGRVISSYYHLSKGAIVIPFVLK